MRNSEQIEANSEENGRQSEESCEQAKKQLPEAMRAFCWKPGQSGNPNGRPKRDFAAELCRAVIEENPDLVYKGILRTLGKGSAFALQVVSDRGYGKLKESVELSGNVSISERLEKARKRKNGTPKPE